MLIVLGAIIVGRRLSFFLAAFFGLAALLLAEDQMRWQPWVYQYSSMLVALAFVAWRKPDAASTSAALNSCRLVIVATYFWSGVQKLNVAFVRQTWPDLTAGVSRWVPGLAQVPAAFALVIPFVEIAIAAGLAAPRVRKMAVTLAIATHAIILTILISSRENTVVWPWNIAMILMVSILFWGHSDTSLFKQYRAIGFQATALVFGLLPALSFVDAWDSYLSGALYSGNVSQAVVYLGPDAIRRLPVEIQPHIWQAKPPYFLDINRWAFGELNVPVYPEPRVFRRVAEQVCMTIPEDEFGPWLRILEKPDPFTGARQSEFYDCGHLGSR